jgi:hypothetical protein
MKDGQHTRRCNVPWTDLYTTKASAVAAARKLTRENPSVVHEVKQCSNCDMWYTLASGQK